MRSMAFVRKMLAGNMTATSSDVVLPAEDGDAAPDANSASLSAEEPREIDGPCASEEPLQTRDEGPKERPAFRGDMGTASSSSMAPSPGQPSNAGEREDLADLAEPEAPDPASFLRSDELPGAPPVETEPEATANAGAAALPPKVPGQTKRGPPGCLDGSWLLANSTSDTATWLHSLDIDGASVTDGGGKRLVIVHDAQERPLLCGGRLELRGESLVRFGKTGRVQVYLRNQS